MEHIWVCKESDFHSNKAEDLSGTQKTIGNFGQTKVMNVPKDHLPPVEIMKITSLPGEYLLKFDVLPGMVVMFFCRIQIFTSKNMVFGSLGHVVFGCFL